ncbi:hypothetical protein AB0C12_43085 [Actinoplanes sp. NPDC048967]|uniref:hypothetical protein n=1 Tax=Actinoplanes sp. NPDC048967 TaxID=3155269 RepID=UPI003403D5A7
MTAEMEGVGDDGEWIDWPFDPWLLDFLAVKAVAEPTPSPLTRGTLAEAERLTDDLLSGPKAARRSQLTRTIGYWIYDTYWFPGSDNPVEERGRPLHSWVDHYIAWDTTTQPLGRVGSKCFDAAYDLVTALTADPVGQRDVFVRQVSGFIHDAYLHDWWTEVPG